MPFHAYKTAAASKNIIQGIIARARNGTNIGTVKTGSPKANFKVYQKINNAVVNNKHRGVDGKFFHFSKLDYAAHKFIVRRSLPLFRNCDRKADQKHTRRVVFCVRKKFYSLQRQLLCEHYFWLLDSNCLFEVLILIIVFMYVFVRDTRCDMRKHQMSLLDVTTFYKPFLLYITAVLSYEESRLEWSLWLRKSCISYNTYITFIHLQCSTKQSPKLMYIYNDITHPIRTTEKNQKTKTNRYLFLWIKKKFFVKINQHPLIIYIAIKAALVEN